MSWAHLPVAGGIYDQHPEFVSLMSYLFNKKAEAEAKKEEQREQKSKNTPSPKGRRHR